MSIPKNKEWLDRVLIRPDWAPARELGTNKAYLLLDVIDLLLIPNDRPPANDWTQWGPIIDYKYFFVWHIEENITPFSGGVSNPSGMAGIIANQYLSQYSPRGYPKFASLNIHLICEMEHIELHAAYAARSIFSLF